MEKGKDGLSLYLRTFLIRLLASVFRIGVDFVNMFANGYEVFKRKLSNQMKNKHS